MTIQVQTGIQPSQKVMEFIRRNEEAILVATDKAVELGRDARVAEQRVLLLLDLQDERARRIARVGVATGRFPDAAGTGEADAIVMVLPIDAVRGFVEHVSEMPTADFDLAARYADCTRGMLFVVISDDATFVASLPRRGVEIARA